MTKEVLDISKLHILNEDFINSGVFKEKFDVIFGNPPYVSFYGRRAIKKTESQRELILKNFKQFQNVKNGKMNLSMLFIEKSLNLLKY